VFIVAIDRNPVDRKINVMIAIAGLGIGGAEVVIQRLAESIDRSRFNLTICCVKVRGRIGDELAANGTDIVVLSDGGEMQVNYLTFLRLLKFIREKQIDVIHTHSTDSLADAAVCKLLRPSLKLVHTFHFGNYPHLPGRQLSMERVFSRFATRLIAVGEVQRQQVRSVFGFADRAIGRIWNGVAVPEPAPDNSFRANLNIGNKILIGVTATLTEQKGLFDLLAVARKVKDARGNVHFAIIGEGRLRPRLETMRSELGLDDTVTLCGWVTNAAQVALPALDIFFQPSLWEAMSIALLEAMATGRPIVATRVGEAIHVVEDGKDGILVEPKDIDGMTAALCRLIDDAGLRKSMSIAASEKAKRQFSVANMTRAYEDLYISLLPKHPVSKVSNARPQSKL
jgi:glycosyltransferase involved in cell wall biosynthesis